MSATPDAAGAADRLRALLADFAASSRSFKWRVLVVAVWALLSVASVAFAFTGGEDNPIDARVNVVDTGFGTALDIQNEGNAIWQDVTVVLDPGGWTYRRANVRPKARIAAQAVDFSRPSAKGPPEHAPREYEPTRVTIRTAEGVYSTEPRGRR